MKIATFINRPVLSCVLSVFVVILGVIGLLRLPMEQFPEIAPPTVRVSATYTGANAETLQRSVMLDPSKFIRANKQFIVARDAICDLTVWFDSRLKINLTTDTPEPVYISKNKVAEFKEWLTAE